MTQGKVNIDILVKFVVITMIISNILIKNMMIKIDPDFALVYKERDSDLTLCLITTSWFQDPGFKIQMCFFQIKQDQTNMD